MTAEITIEKDHVKMETLIKIRISDHTLSRARLAFDDLENRTFNDGDNTPLAQIENVRLIFQALERVEKGLTK